MNRERTQAFKHVLRSWRWRVPDTYLARIVQSLAGSGIDPDELDRLIADDVERGISRLADDLAALPTTS